MGCVDLISNSHFPILAAEELGFYKAAGLDSHVELVRAPAGFRALKEGALDAVATSAHAALTSFSRSEGAKLVLALAQGVPWLLIMRSNFAAERGDMNALRGCRIAAANDPAIVFQQVIATRFKMVSTAKV